MHAHASKNATQSIYLLTTLKEWELLLWRKGKTRYLCCFSGSISKRDITGFDIPDIELDDWMLRF